MSFLSGIDVSQWQPTTPSLAGLAFGFARATYGTGIDPVYAHHYANFRAAGIVAGAYAFGTNGDGAAQAAAFLEVAHDADLLALDLEAESGKPQMTENQARAFIAAVQGVGRKCGLYHSDSGFPDLNQDWSWVARWGNFAPTREWTLWQYQGSPLDLDRFNGTEAELHALAGTAGDAMLTLPEGITSPQRVRIVKAGDLLDAAGGKRVASVPVGRTYPYLGTTPGYKAVLVRTAIPYSDGKERPTQLYVHADMAVIEDVPVPTTSNTTTVVLSINGSIVYPNATS